MAVLVVLSVYVEAVLATPKLVVVTVLPVAVACWGVLLTGFSA